MQLSFELVFGCGGLPVYSAIDLKGLFALCEMLKNCPDN